MPARPGAGWTGWRCWASAGSRRTTGGAPARRQKGDVDDALAIWGRIAPGTSRYANATLRRARLAIDRGRFAVAEETLERARGAFPPGSTARDLHEIMLQQIYLFTSRDDELRRRKRRGSGHRDGQGRRPPQALDDRRDLGLPARRAADAPGRRGACGARGRPGVAGEGEPGDADGPVRRGRRLAEAMPGASSRRPGGVACAAGMGDGVGPDAGCGRGGAALAGRWAGAGVVTVAPGLAGRPGG